MVVITGRRQVSLSGLETWGMVRQEMGGVPAEVLRVRAPPLASREWEGGDLPILPPNPPPNTHTQPPPPSEGRREPATISPGFVLTARLENAWVGRLGG